MRPRPSATLFPYTTLFRSGRRYIANNPGRGYTFIAPVTRENAASSTAAPDGKAKAGSLPGPLTRIVGRDEIIAALDRKSTRLNSSHANISYAVFCLKKKNQ